MTDLLTLHSDDTVAVLTAPRPALNGRPGVAAGHKIAIRAMAAGEAVVKFGQFIGTATGAIAPGDHVHSHNCAFAPNRNSLPTGSQLEAAQAAVPTVGEWPQRTGPRTGHRNAVGTGYRAGCP